MNKYQEALENLKICTDAHGCYCCKLEKTCKNPEEWIFTLQELIDQQHDLTFSECIKEWGNRGFKVERKRNKKGYDIEGFTAHQKEKFISIGVKDQQYVWLSDETLLSFEEVYLLSKTIKALEEMKDESN